MQQDDQLTMLPALTKCYNNGFLSDFVDCKKSQMGRKQHGNSSVTKVYQTVNNYCVDL